MCMEYATVHTELQPQVQTDGQRAEKLECTKGTVEVERRRYDLSQSGKPAGVWTRYSKLQAFRSIRSLRGRASVSVYLYILNLASNRSKRSNTVGDLKLRIKVDTIADRTGLTERTVRRALDELEGKFIARTAGRRADTIWFLNPDSPGETLQTSPGNWDLLSAQGINSYVVFPKDSLPVIYRLNVTETAVYVTVMDLVTVEQDEVLWISRRQLQEQSGLGREGFRSGLDGCKEKHLFRHSKNGVLEVFDPKNHIPSERWRRPKGFQYAKYEVQPGDFDLATVSPETRAELVTEHVGLRVENPTEQTWFKKLVCPLCNEQNFSISFIADGYHCWSCGPHPKEHRTSKHRDNPELRRFGQGRICQLVSRVKDIPMKEAVRLFREKHERETLQEV